MKILGIETSCDETSAAVVEDGQRLYSNVVVSQIDIHAEYGGVIPEIAARSHIEVINPVIRRALEQADCTWEDIDAIAVTYAPGLIGSLLVGTLAARTLAMVHDKPLYRVHHVEGHVYANFITDQVIGHGDRSVDAPLGAVGARDGDESLTSSGSAELADAQTSSSREEAKLPSSRLAKAPTGAQTSLALPARQPSFPLLALIVSGGHSQLVLLRGHGDFDLLGQTRDDAVGEAFDKVAKIIGLPYPGGPSIAKAAELGDPSRYDLPISKLDSPYDFSFSGLKTAVLRSVQRETGNDHTFPSHKLAELLTTEQRYDFAASFQQTAVRTLVLAAKRAYQEHQPASVVIAGGVAANTELRRQLSEALPLDIEYAPMSLCTDNAAMIAALAYYRADIDQPIDPRELEVVPSLRMTAGPYA